MASLSVLATWKDQVTNSFVETVILWSDQTSHIAHLREAGMLVSLDAFEVKTKLHIPRNSCNVQVTLQKRKPICVLMFMVFFTLFPLKNIVKWTKILQSL